MSYKDTMTYQVNYVKYKEGIKRWLEIYNKKEVNKVNKIPYFETKVVKVKKEKECQHCYDKYPYICAMCGQVVKRPKHKGNWVNGENLDKIKFPCFCSYVNGSTKYYGEIHHSRYYGLYRIEGQDIHSFVDEMSSLRHLIEVYNIHILKGKIIIFEEEETNEK